MSAAFLECTSITLGELQTNCYIVSCPHTRAAVVIDPADSGDTITSYLLEQQLDLQAILLTHGHFDHCLGLLELQLNFSVPAYIHKKDLFLVQQAQKSAEHWLKHTVDPVPTPSEFLYEGQEITFGECSLTVISTPGHTPGSVCFISKPESSDFKKEQFIFSKSGFLFTGDTLFKDAITRTDFRYSSVLQLHSSIDRLKHLPSRMEVFAGHGDQTSLQEALENITSPHNEKDENSFIV